MSKKFDIQGEFVNLLSNLKKIILIIIRKKIFVNFI